MKKIFVCGVILFLFLLSGCATQKNRPNYVWLSYSSSLYATKKTPTSENVASHKQVLLEIMEESKKQNGRVPPGVYCEYGYMLLKEGKKEEAVQYFDLEEQTYPESKIFIQSLKAYALKSEKKDETKDTAAVGTEDKATTQQTK